MGESNVFSTRAMEQALRYIKEVWSQGLPKSCDIALGVFTTRLNPLSVQINADFSVSRSSEHFALRIRGRGPNREPQVENFFFGNPAKKQVFVVPKFSERWIDTIGQLFASAAFPIAFPPIKLQSCLLTKQEFKNGCSKKDLSR